MNTLEALGPQHNAARSTGGSDGSRNSKKTHHAGWYRSSTARFYTVPIQHDRSGTARLCMRIIEHRIDWTRHDSAPARLCTNRLCKNDSAPAQLCTNRLCKNDSAPARLCTKRLYKNDSAPARLCTNRFCKNDSAPARLCTNRLCKNDLAPARLCTNRLCKNNLAPARLCTVTTVHQ